MKKKNVNRVQSHIDFMKKWGSSDPYWQNFLKFAEMFLLSIKQKYIKNKNFHRAVFKLLAWKGQKLGIFDLIGIAMATNFYVTGVSIWSLLNPTQMCTESNSSA